MNWVDLTIIGVFLYYFFEGIRRGFIEQTLELIGFFITVFLALLGYHYFGALVMEKTGIQKPAADPIAFIILWFVYQVLYSLILRYTYPNIPTKFRNTLPNRLAGLIPAFLKGVVILSIILTVVLSLPVPVKLKSEISGSFLGSGFVNNSATVENFINKVVGGDLKESLTFLTVPAQNEQIIAPSEKIDLKFTTDQTTVDKASEAKMFQWVNEERTKAGVGPLVVEERLTEVARTHSKDMFNRGFFAHENPDGQSPFDRMAKGGITFEVAGENIAYAPSVELAHNGLMRSPGHRANILNPEFGHVGYGIIDAGIYGKMFSQEFTN
ncbi:MAG: CvpA family protein [Candidatus Berkelbacteria bacterium]|nr:CvpA family protein [Candidatus Berkelbacteria bacterium]MCR4307218.1 CvpA family protein [Candidatus Berkelbacteria bacterium]